MRQSTQQITCGGIEDILFAPTVAANEFAINIKGEFFVHRGLSKGLQEARSTVRDFLA